jgi:uncharacterized protein (TIRG00374 family)
LVTLLKLAVVAGLVWWLIASGKLDFGELKIFVEHPDTLVYNVAIWIVCYVGLGALRWYVLLRGLDLEVSYLKTVRLQMIGFFFNTAMPGAVGGDIVKAVYVIREQRAQRKTPAMLTILLDRVVGLMGLFVMAGAAAVWNWHFVSHDKALMRLSIVSGAVFLALVLGAALVFIPKEGRDPIARLLKLQLPGFGVLRSIYDALRSYRHKPYLLLFTVALSCLIQTASMLFAIYVTQLLEGFTPDFATFATIYPLALMTTALPLAPGGLGVGHVAFDTLFQMVGWKGGANMFNVVILGQLALNLTGFIPYLLHRSELPDADELTGLGEPAPVDVRTV